MKVVTPEEAGKALIGKENIIVMTGAGISAGSGIPTYRDENGFWKSTERRIAGLSNPMEISTSKVFFSHPDEVWWWDWDFIEIRDKCKPNQGHYEITKFQEWCATNNQVDCMLIT